MPATTLEGVLERVTYMNEENGWSVVKLAVSGRREPVTVVGNLLGVQPGENLRLRGSWTVDRKWGEQFRADSYATVRPADLVGIERYLASGLIRGIGEVMAGRLVARFGLATLEVIERQPERLGEVAGIGPVRRARIAHAWQEQRQIREVMVFLQAHGVTTSLAAKIFKRYGAGTVELVKQNPYRLARDIFGIGFQTADRIATQLGVAGASSERAQAGLLHVLDKREGEGHVLVPRRALVAETAELLQVGAAAVDAAVDALARAGEAVVTPLLEKEEEGEPLRGTSGLQQAAGTRTEASREQRAAGGGSSRLCQDEGGREGPPLNAGTAVYLRRLHAAEEGAARLLRGLLAAPAAPLSIDVPRALAWYEEQQRIELAPEQREAIGRALVEKVLVVTGGPGTGKTTLVNGVLRILEQKRRRILLAAPTGRAAKRLSESTGREAATLHRLLEFSPRTMSFERGRERPLEADLVVVDEASMIDLPLLHSLLKALPPPCRLVLVGDADQLPSVGPGAVLADLLRSGAVGVVRLRHIFRQAEASLIVTNAHRINRGELPEAQAPGAKDDEAAPADFYFIEKDEPEEILEVVRTLVRERIPARFGLDAIDGVQVLSPMHRGLLGAINLNAELQALLNPEGETVAHGSRLFRAGDKVMQIRNNYDLEVYNGDIGRIESLDPAERSVAVRFDGRRVAYDTADLGELVLAYACSVHKSQGSEYPCVVLPLHTQHYAMLQRNLLYTGVTRGRRLVVIVGSRRALRLAVQNDRAVARHGQLAALLRRAEPG